MNIFALDENPIVAAEYHCDKHTVKMILESTQLLSNVYWLHNLTGCYKLTHKHHPATLWVAKSLQNFNLLATMALTLCKEYTYRYGKVHKCEAMLKELNQRKYLIPFSEIQQTPFAQCMPEQYKSTDAIMAYRNYYNAEKRRFAKWTTRTIPKWFQDYNG
jgi:hypothetical protein